MGKFKNKKKIIIIVAVLLAAVGIFSAARLLFADDARDTYFKAESKNIEKYLQWVDKTYTSLMEQQAPYMDMAYSRRMEMTADVKSGGKPFGLNNTDRLSDLIQSSKLVVDTKRQPREGTTISDVTLLIEKTPFVDAELFTKAGMLYFTVPVLLPEKYFSIKLDKIDEVYDKFSIPVRPKKLVNGAGIAGTLQFDKTVLKESAQKLGGVFSKLITEDDVKFGSESEWTISGQKIKGREVQVSLDSSSATALLGELAAFAASDEMLLSYTYGNFADLSTLLEDAGLFRLFEYLDQTGVVVLNENEKGLVNGLNVRKDMEGFRNTLKETLSSYTFKDGLEMTVVIDKAGNILDRKLTLDLTTAEEGKSFRLVLNTGSSSTVFEDCRNRFLKIVVKETGANGNGNSSKTIELKVTPTFAKPDGTDTQGNIAISYAITEQDGVKSGADITLDILGKTDPQTLKRNDILRFIVKMVGETGNGNMDVELNKVSWKNKKLNTTNHTTKITVQADLPSFGIKDLSAVVNLAGEDRVGIEHFTLPEVQQGAVTDLNAATENDLERIEMEVMASFGSFYLTNKPIFDAILAGD